MSRGIGALNVSVNASTARGIKNLRDFQSEARTTGKAGKDMAASFQGNTLKDFQQRFGPKPAVVRQSISDLNDFRSSVVDLSGDVNRYNAKLERSTSLVKQLNAAKQQLTRVTKAAGAAFIFFQGLAFGQKIREHIDHIRSWSDAQRELNALLNRGPSGAEMADQRQQVLMERGEARLARMEARLEAIRQRQKEGAQALGVETRRDAVAWHGENRVKFQEDQQKFGLEQALKINEARQRADAAEAGRADQKKAREDRLAQAKEKEREKERKAQEAERKASEKRRADLQSVAELRQKIADFGKSDLERDRDKMLRTLADPGLRRQAKGGFDELGRLERDKERQELRKKNRETLAGRSGQDSSFLDARTAEGWAALRDNMRQGPQQQLAENSKKQVDHLERIDLNMERMAAVRKETFILKF